jgi:hypothetical protein
VDSETAQGDASVRLVKEQLEAAQALEDSGFRVVPSLNLIAMLEKQDTGSLRKQPRHCHMHLFRQVLTPTGTFGCPVYRANAKAQVGAPTAYRSVEDFVATRRQTFELREKFNAAVECQKVTCLYNSANWWLESVRGGEATAAAGESARDFFL